MVFRFYGPFEKAAGREFELPLDREVPLRELIPRLPAPLQAMIPGPEGATDVEVWAHVMFFCSGRLLKLDDPVSDEETVKVMLPAMGG